MSDDIVPCTVIASGKSSWAVNVPAELAFFLPRGRSCRIALDDDDLEWRVPPSFHGETPSGCKCRHIIKAQIRDWLKIKGRTSPSGAVYMRYVGHDRFRLGHTRKEVQKHRKKDTERFLLEEFLNIQGYEPDWIRPGEAPDFTVRLGGQTVGVEITEFHAPRTGADGRPRRAIEGDWQRIQQVLRHRRERHPQLKQIDAFLHFKRLEVPRWRDHTRFVQELLSFADAHASEVSGERRAFSEFPKSCFPLSSHYLLGIDLWQPSYIVFNWSWNQSVSFVGVSEAELLGALRGKLLAGRPSGVQEYWVLVVAGTGIQQAMGPVAVSQLHDYVELHRALANGPADKVYLYQYYRGEVFVWDTQTGWRKAL